MRNNILKTLTITVCVILIACFSLLGCKKKNPATPSGSEQASVESGSNQDSGETSESESDSNQDSGETSESENDGEQENVKQPIDSGDLELPIIKN